MPMQSRTDQVHSYEFFLQRIISGMVARESDPAELPFRRLGWSGFGSVMVTIIVAAVFGIIGVLAGGGNTSWQDNETIIVQKGSEQIYVYIDDRLHPVINMVSAQLLRPGGEVKRVSARSLEGVRRGVTLGITGAPQGLPGNGDLLTGPWTLCSQEQPDGEGGFETISVLGVGRPPDGGQPVDEQAVLVQDASTQDYYMIWRGYRFEISSQVDATLREFAVSESQALPVSSAWLDGLPEGGPLAPPSAGEPGQPTTVAEDRVTGDVIDDRGRFFLVRSDDLVEMTELQANIVLRALDGQAIPARRPNDAETIELDRPTEGSPPPQAPGFVSGDVLGSSVCSVYASREFTPQLLAGGLLDPQASGNETPQVSQEGSLLADYVVIEGGKAVLVQSLTSPTGTGAWHIVNEQGQRFALPSLEVAGVFGYGEADAVRMSGGLVDLLAGGPDLDPAAAEIPALVATSR